MGNQGPTRKMGSRDNTPTRPFLALQTIPFTGLPFLRMTDKGLADIKSKRSVSLYVKWRYCPQPVDQYTAHLLMMFEEIVLLSLKQPAGHHMLEGAQN